MKNVELMYISLIVSISIKYHLHGFQQLVLLPYFIEIFFFHLYQQNKSSKSKVKFRQASNHCKRVLEAAKLPYAILKQKSPSLPFVFSKGKSAIPPLFNAPEVSSSASDKAKLFA